MTDRSARTPRFLQAGGYQLELGRKTYMMGILNITPDSFSDGGRYLKPDAALYQAESLVQAGADLLDIGGESTRPGSRQVPAAEQIDRILPVIHQLARHLTVPISVDTTSAAVAEATLAAGASMINDVSGLFADPAMASVAARYQAAVVLMHNAALYRPDHPASKTFQDVPRLPESLAAQLRGIDLLAAVRACLHRSCSLALASGLHPNQLVLDPGLGFGLTTAESLRLIDELDHIQCLPGHFLPILSGPSRKRFIGDVLDMPVESRLQGTAAAVAASILRGADFVRIHDVEAISQTVRMCDAICRRQEIPVNGDEQVV